MKNIKYYLLLLLIGCTISTLLQAQTSPRDSFEIAGRVLTTSGHPMPNVEVILVGPSQTWVDTTQVDGIYAFQGIPGREDYSVQFIKEGPVANGLDPADISIIRSEILYFQILNPFAFFGGDINGGFGLSTLDIVVIARILLGYSYDAPTSKRWRFLYAYTDFDLENPNNIDGTIPKAIDTYPIGGLNQNLHNIDFIGLKKGDVNLTADPY